MKKLCCVLAGAFLLAASASAQDKTKSDTAPAAVPSSQAPAAMPQAVPGDSWTYQVKDEISGAVRLTRTDLVTDASTKAIAVRVDIAGTGRSGNIIFDPEWNLVRDQPFRYSPNDGTGFRFPLAVGKEWKFAADVTNSRVGTTFRRTGSSRVVGQETVTTPAGTFDTFVVETHFAGRQVQNPTVHNDTTYRTWFDPKIDHWVKREVVYRQNGALIRKDMWELSKFSEPKEK